MTRSDINRIRNRTKQGLVSYIYTTQKNNSKKRGHIVKYTKQELIDWLYSQHLFHDLYDLWVMSGFDKNQRPSVDRIKNKIGYEFGNIQVMTWRDNQLKYADEVASKVENGTRVKVVQLTKDEKFVAVFDSVTEAADSLGRTKGNISSACSGHRKSAYGFKWKYL